MNNFFNVKPITAIIKEKLPLNIVENYTQLINELLYFNEYN